MKTDEIFKQIYEDLKAEIDKNTDDIFLKEYTIPSINYSPDSEYFASGIEMELERMISQFDYKIYYSSYKEKYFFSNSNEMVQSRMLAEIEKETKAELKQKLEEKINTEFKEFVENLKKCEPEVILDRAYEKVSKEEMIYKILDKDYDKMELQALLKTEGILQECYDEWLKSDSNFNEVLEYAVDDRIDLIVEDYKEKQAKKSRESR